MSYPLILTRREAATTPPAVRALPGREGLIALPFELMAPLAPIPFQAGGQVHLCTKLHVTNFSIGQARR